MLHTIYKEFYETGWEQLVRFVKIRNMDILEFFSLFTVFKNFQVEFQFVNND